MRLNNIQIGVMVLVALILGFFLGHSATVKKEGFESGSGDPHCGGCGGQWPCKRCSNPETRPVCPPCREPDMSKFVLKSSVPPCPSCPDMSQYMLKTECPPTPDLSNYVLKSSIPKNQPIIIDTSCEKRPCGECPPCPRPRCPTVQCPEPVQCPPPAPCPRPVCPPQVVKCKAEQSYADSVRPFLAPLSMSGFGQA
jgi:hypothetical protein